MKRKVLSFVLALSLAITSATVSGELFSNSLVKVNAENSVNGTDKDSNGDGLLDSEESNPLEWQVCDRDLAIFSSLSYKDGSNFVGRMYQASDLEGTDRAPGEKYYFLNGASIDETGVDYGIAKNWTIVDYVNEYVMSDTNFSATTYKNGNNIVIAYRGTDDPVGEWVANVCSGVINYHVEEEAAKNYAKKIAALYPDCNFYLTGHSLGGYLCQIGASELIGANFKNLKAVVYFNGIGLKYNKALFWTKKTEINNLTNYYKAGNRLVSYEIKGDMVSAIGTHCGDVVSFYPVEEARENHKGEFGTESLGKIRGEIETSALGVMFGHNLVQYYNYYGTTSFQEYFKVTHELDSFFYYLNQGTRSAQNNIAKRGLR